MTHISIYDFRGKNFQNHTNYFVCQNKSTRRVNPFFKGNHILTFCLYLMNKMRAIHINIMKDVTEVLISGSLTSLTGFKSIIS